jgi:cation transport regulator ChaC
MTLLFQYGSNCNADRLNAPERLDGAAENPRLARTVDASEIAFNVWSQGNGCAASNLVPTPGQYAWGVLYDIPTDRLKGQRADGKKTMAQIEGPRYEPTTIGVRTADGREVRATTFLVKKDAERDGLWTSREYVEHIVAGLRQNTAPPEYIEHVITVAVEHNQRAKERADEEATRIATLRAL